MFQVGKLRILLFVVLGLLVATLLACNGGSSDDGNGDVMTSDTSSSEGMGSAFDAEYRTVHLQRGPGLGYCVVEGQVLDGTLMVAEGSATYEGTITALGNPETDTCLDAFVEGQCLVEAPFGPVKVSQDQLDELHSLITKVPEEVCVRNPEISCDPCVILSITVDDREASPFCCGTVSEDFVKAVGELADFLDLLAPTPEPAPPPTDTPVPPTDTPVPATATPTPTALSEELKERILRTYAVIELIQLGAEGTKEIADGLASGELDSFQAGMMRLAVATIIQSAEELMPDLDPPEELADVWEDALKVHEATKDVLRRWFNEEIDSKQVLVEMPDILRDAEKAARDAQEAIEAAWEIAAEELSTMRDEVLQEFERLFSPTPTP